MKLSSLWVAPEVNPINHKARSVPFLNPLNIYGRVNFFAWFGFMVAFWAWYTFPPLLTHVITKNLGLTPAQVANSNIVSLCATLLVRVVAGPLCDQFGPRIVFGGLLLVGSIPLGLAPLVHDATGLYCSRFFIGILGGTFVPCQVWSTGFFDKNIVGTANAITGGWGNAGGGITYFIMPAVFDSLSRRGYSNSTAWRLTFIVPLVVVITTAVGLLLLCPDTPTGKWSERELQATENLQAHSLDEEVTPNGVVVDIPGSVTDRGAAKYAADEQEHKVEPKHPDWDHEAALSKNEMLETARGEIITKPTIRDAARVIFSLQTAFHIFTYACSFGCELALDAILSAYYVKNFPSLGATEAANWAAMFGFLNFVTRPLGGILSDILYRASGRSLWVKKAWIVGLGVVTGALLVIIGKLDPRDQATMFGLVTALAFFLEAGNGANFALVPHVHPHSNGVVSGVTGAGGNLGGIAFAVVFRFMGSGTDYAKGFWVIGVIMIGLNLALCWVRPIPKGQVGGH
ncbi:nitrite transporter [Xylariales sp. PMI_506]|nr:nitrite transporter [Xylariales sp. PMI_506]